MSSLEIQLYSERASDLLRRARACVSELPEGLGQALSTRVPDSIVPDTERVRVVFAGQYSSGKSTLIRAMTGRDDIEVGPGIVTQTTQEFDFGGITVIDTPGVHTELRPDHDVISYEAIKGADLVVFVITNSLFDAHLAQHFRNLAIEVDKGHEMMLVVNKMRRSAGGNTSEVQAVIREDLSRVLTPFSPDDLRVSFVDAESVLDSACEPDPELVSMLRRKSGFDAFVDGFNDFVRSKGLMGRYTTSLYQLEQVLQEAISAVTIGDDDVARLETVLLQQRRALLDTKSEIPRSVAERVTRVTENIRSLGRDLADSIDGELKEAEFAAKIENAQRRTDELVDELVEDVLRTIESRLANLAEHFSAIARSQVSTELLASLGRRIPVMNGVVVGVVGAGTAHLGDAGKIVAGLGQFLVQNAFHGKGDGFGAIFDLKEYSGTLVHDGIKWGGKLLGKKFRPWEAVKMTKNVAHLGRAMVIVGPIVSIIFQAKQDADAKKREIALREGRAQVRASFNEAAQVVEMHFDEATGAYIAASLQPDIARLDTQIAELRSMQSTKSAAFDALSDLLDQVRNLIREMHGSPSFINRVSAS